MHRYRAMMDHWAEHGPPMYMSLAAYLGHKPSRSAKRTGSAGAVQDPSELANFLRTMPGGTVT